MLILGLFYTFEISNFSCGILSCELGKSQKQWKKLYFVNSVCFSFNFYYFLVYDLQNRVLLLLVMSPSILSSLTKVSTVWSILQSQKTSLSRSNNINCINMSVSMTSLWKLVRETSQKGRSSSWVWDLPWRRGSWW